jgi:hypothetical protein
MTVECGASRDSPCGPIACRSAYPRRVRAMAQSGCRCLRRDAKCTPSFTWQRSAPGRRAQRRARDPGGPERPLAAKRQQWRGAADRPSASRCDREPRRRGEREAKDRTGTEIAVTRAPQGSLGTRKGPGGLFPKSPRGGPAGSPGTGSAPVPWAAERRPRTRRTPGPGHAGAGDGRRVRRRRPRAEKRCDERHDHRFRPSRTRAAAFELEGIAAPGCSSPRGKIGWRAAGAQCAVALPISSVIFLASPSSIMVLSR